MVQDYNIENDIVINTRRLKNEFEEIVSMYSSDLWNYCKYVTGSAWDGEDLYQETLIKSFGLLPYRWNEITNKNTIYSEWRRIHGLISAESLNGM